MGLLEGIIHTHKNTHKKEWKLYTRFYLEKPTQMRRKRTKWQVQKQNKKIIIGDDPIQYPDVAVTMDEDCDRG